MDSQGLLKTFRIAILIAVISAVAIVIGTTIGSGNFFLAAGIAVLGVAIVGFQFREWFPVLAIAFMTMPHRGSLLMGLGYWELLAFITIGFTVWDRVITKRYANPFQPNLTVVCLTLTFITIPLHMVAAKTGIGFEESGGGRLSLYTVSVLLFCWLITSGFIPLKHMRWLPWLGTIPGVIIFLCDLITFLVPDSIPILNTIYPQNQDAIISFVGSDRTGFRLRGTRELGIHLVLLMSAYILASRGADIRKWVMRLFASLPFAAALAAVSGFRSAFLAIASTIFLGCFKRAKVALFILAISGIAGLCSLSLFQSFGGHVPTTIQRAVSWFPGKWDYEVKFSGSHSVDYRFDLWRKWYETVFPDVWLIGRGENAEGESLVEHQTKMNMIRMMAYNPTYGNYIYQSMLDSAIDSQNLHSGAICLIDFTGVVGLLFFLIATGRCFWNCWVLYRSERNLQPWQAWVLIFILHRQFYFWGTAQLLVEIANFVVSFTLIEIIRKMHEGKPAREPVEKINAGNGKRRRRDLRSDGRKDARRPRPDPVLAPA